MHLLPSLASGGVEQVVLELCQGLTEQGIENIVVSAGGAMVPAIEEAGAKHHLRPIGKKSLFTLLQIGKLAKLIKTEKPDIFTSKIAEGRLGILVDGSPIALTTPYTLTEDLQTVEDYFVSPFVAKTSNTPSPISRIDTSKVPPPRS